MKIGFLFNHDQVHQVAHALPVALAMARGYPQAQVVVATTNATLTAEVRRLCARLGVDVELVQLGLTRPSTRVAARALEWAVPVTKIGVYRDNLPFFRSLDALVVAEKTSLLLKTRYGLKDLRIIHTRHGAGDRAIGFNRQSALFDHVLVSGAKVRERLIREAGVAPERTSLVGYPKFDLMPDPAPRLPFQANGKPTVLYNPHPSPHLSSWYEQGRAVLEHFLYDDRYNLIFAPHVMLFHRKFVMTIDKLRFDRAGTIDQRFYDAPNIHIDLGSSASTDMTYTAAADIYLGDVSSQVYEFLHRPRPCLFLDAHATAWQGDANYAHWQAGEVIGSAADLGAALDRAVATHDRYRPVQRALFARSFELTAEPSAVRAARAVISVLGGSAQAAPIGPDVQPEAAEGLRVA
ncbi:hypothetical protein SAMN05192583_1145 [Sphingomonas gellani]|uniref:CDP-glycerol glycerophosphotransferase, TagB/SpsB family n=1 Tax=Sphingomonas gellani TaxID=1166340 RepID=A0A1H8B050_9SPHN|nr:hypothetical protein [Sphingomonas gellani]SEM76371.1 hypothetical protein SAMN05192583_1145 [Sphingomonas gellani]